jgi:NAD(P)H-flavin reductase
MYKILHKQLLTSNIYLMKVLAPRVAKSAKPGQFVIVRTNETGERVPLTICDYNDTEGSITIVFQVVGKSTRMMEALNENDGFLDFVGPLGKPTELMDESLEELKHKKILFVGGGVGTAPVYPQVKWLHENGVDADVIIGAKNADTFILMDEMKAVAGNLFLATDDGSLGYKGFVTNLLKDLVENQGKKYDLVVTIGPMIMMLNVSKMTKELGIKTIASLNTLMVCGAGMCGACRVTVNGVTKFTCYDGPEFDAHAVDFGEAMRRQGMYKNDEKKRDQQYQI